MIIPVDIPNPNQDNVFYTIPALKAELLNYFNSEKVATITEKYSKYYLPTFVFDVAGAPHVYSLDVYPKDAQKESIQLDSIGNIVDVIQRQKPVVKSPDPRKLHDNQYGCVLDPKFYVDTKLKEPNDIEFSIEVAEPTIDLLLSTKWYEDDNLSEKSQNFTILKKILIERIKLLPENELTVIKEQYENTLATIDEFLVSLDDVQKGQEKSLDLLKYSKLFPLIYSQTELPNDVSDPFVKTKIVLAQALSDWANIYASSSTGWKLYRGNMRNDSSINQNLVRSTGSRSLLNNNKEGQSIWPNFLDKLKSINLLENTSLETPFSGKISNAGADVDSVLKYQGTDVYSSNGKPKEWYYDNLKKTVQDIPVDWSGLDNYIETILEVKEPYSKKARLDLLGGGHLLVDQAIYKSILKLCMNGINVGEYAPKLPTGENFFTVIGRSPSLGPAGTTPWPSKYTIPVENYQVKSYSNTGFLCFHALIGLINRVGYGTDGTPYDFLIKNIEEPDSDLDDVIDLVTKISSGYLTSNVSKELPSDGSSPSKRSTKQLMHLYKKGAQFPVSSDILLIPLHDDMPISERTFLSWNMKPTDHTTEKAVRNGTDVDENIYSLLSDDFPNAVRGGTNGGTLEIGNAPLPWAAAGYLAANEDATYNMRLLDVNFGIPDKGNTRNVLKFFKQRRNNTPYFWAAMTSLWRALAIETWKYLIDSVNTISGTEISLSNEEIIANFNHRELWRRIIQVFADLKNESSLKFDAFVCPDGTISLTEDGAESFSFMSSIQNRNTPGLSTRIMLQEWARFVSTISKHSEVNIVEKQQPIKFDFENYIPLEGLSIKTNINYSNSHGGGSQYIESTFREYFDKLEFLPGEITKKELIKKIITPAGPTLGTNFSTRQITWLSDIQVLYQHQLLYDNIVSALENIKTFVGGFSVPASIQKLLDTKRLDLSTDIADPQRLINQIVNSREKYKANEFGLGNRWNWQLDIEDLHKVANREEWLYVQVIGLKKECWPNTSLKVKLIPQYITAKGPIDLSGASIQVSYFDDTDSKFKDLLNWLHLSTGLDISELTFSKNIETIWSDSLINSESGVFPWQTSDFENGVPTKELEPLFQMSPWLFPQNMFNDICVTNTYHRVIACIITRKHLTQAGIGLEMVDGKIDDIIGSIRWKIV